MKSEKLPTCFGISVLGAINGLLIGLIVGEARIVYLAHQMSQARREFDRFYHDLVVDFFYPDRNLLVPFVCIIAFAATSYLVYQYFLSRPQALLLLWIILGAVAVWVGYFMSTSRPDVFSFMWVLIFAVVSYLVHRLWKNHAHSFLLFWLVSGISAVIIVAAGVQLIGLFFYWPVPRNSLLWLLCLVAIMIINSIYGALLQLIFQRELKNFSL